MITVLAMAALRLVLAAIVVSASAPAIAAAAPAAAPGWKVDGACALCEPGLVLSDDVRAALAQTAATPLVATAVVALRPPVRTALAVAFVVAGPPAPAAVLPSAPKTSPPT